MTALMKKVVKLSFLHVKLARRSLMQSGRGVSNHVLPLAVRARQVRNGSCLVMSATVSVMFCAAHTSRKSSACSRWVSRVTFGLPSLFGGQSQHLRVGVL